MRKQIAITGNIGSGKTTIAHLFNLMGIPVYNADMEAKKILNSPTVIQEIAAVVGNQVLNEHLQIDHKILASIIFSDPVMMEAVNGIIHPKVIEDYKQWTKTQDKAPFTLFESAIIFEHKLEVYFDAIILVYCPDEIAIIRASKRDHATTESIKKRLKAQMSSLLKKEKADYIIHNYDNHSVIAQSLEIFEKLSK